MVFQDTLKRLERLFLGFCEIIAKNCEIFCKATGEITPSKLISLKADLYKVIDEEVDFVCIIKLLNDNVFGEELLGKKDKKTGEDLII